MVSATDPKLLANKNPNAAQKFEIGLKRIELEQVF